MSTFPVRRLGATGIVADANPYDLEDASTFSSGVNVRFKDGKATRAPLARTIANLGSFTPGHILTVPASSGGEDQIVMAASDFSTIIYQNGASPVDMTPSDWSGSATNDRFTSSVLGGVTYLNRFTHVPVYKGPTDAGFARIPDWNADDRCVTLRSYKDFLVALGVQKAGQFYPTMVKWSDLTGFGAPPASWDPTSTTNSAGENIVNEMKYALVDGLGLRDSFILYCTNEVWTMDYIGGNLLFSWRKLFDSRGVINQNCVVQVEGAHYVFDRNDIWLHDGASIKSICDARVRQYIFQALDFSRQHLCFVSHDPKLSEIRFCYPCADSLVGFRSPTTGCNRAAVYNYASDTWSFYDLPNVTGSTLASLVSSLTWDQATDKTWGTIGGVWLSSNDDEDKHVLFSGIGDASQGLTANRLYGYDLITGGRLPQPPEPEALKDSFLERVGIDLDSQGKNLTQYVRLMGIWPQMSVQRPLDAGWQFGASDIVGDEPLWTPEATFDPTSENKIDINEAGKYLAYRFRCGGQGDFMLSGFDVELKNGGRR